MFSGTRINIRTLNDLETQVRNMRTKQEYQQLQIEFNRDLCLIPTRAISRRNFYVKWTDKLTNTTCDSLKRQLKSFCSKNPGFN